mmetsp:Transcript_54751/g.154106  ORF Transcript_54751/g.154106 Transcript_54751/m.154106 type:complete len:526 (+) Transcript_54751:99-1676(+)
MVGSSRAFVTRSSCSSPYREGAPSSKAFFFFPWMSLRMAWKACVVPASLAPPYLMCWMQSSRRLEMKVGLTFARPSPKSWSARSRISTKGTTSPALIRIAPSAERSACFRHVKAWSGSRHVGDQKRQAHSESARLWSRCVARRPPTRTRRSEMSRKCSPSRRVTSSSVATSRRRPQSCVCESLNRVSRQATALSTKSRRLTPSSLPCSALMADWARWARSAVAAQRSHSRKLSWGSDGLRHAQSSCANRNVVSSVVLGTCRARYSCWMSLTSRSVEITIAGMVNTMRRDPPRCRYLYAIESMSKTTSGSACCIWCTSFATVSCSAAVASTPTLSRMTGSMSVSSLRTVSASPTFTFPVIRAVSMACEAACCSVHSRAAISRAGCGIARTPGTRGSCVKGAARMFTTAFTQSASRGSGPRCSTSSAAPWSTAPSRLASDGCSLSTVIASSSCNASRDESGVAGLRGRAASSWKCPWNKWKTSTSCDFAFWRCSVKRCRRSCSRTLRSTPQCTVAHASSTLSSVRRW